MKGGDFIRAETEKTELIAKKKLDLIEAILKASDDDLNVILEAANSCKKYQEFKALVTEQATN